MGEYVARLDTIGLEDVVEVGGKGANLGELIRAGFKVPHGFSVRVSGYDSFLEVNGLLEPIREVASGIDYSNIADVDEKTSRIRAMFESAEILDDIKTEITEALRLRGMINAEIKSSLKVRIITSSLLFYLNSHLFQVNDFVRLGETSCLNMNEVHTRS